MENQNTATYFDSKLTGFAYFQRARWISTRKGSGYLAVTVCILQGEAGATKNLYVDCNVTGQKAKFLIDQHIPCINDRQTKVSGAVRVSDLYVDTFTYNANHPKSGQTGVSLKGRLLNIQTMKVDGQLVPEASEDLMSQAS